MTNPIERSWKCVGGLLCHLSLSLSLCGPELKEIAREKHAFSSNTDGVIEHMPQY
jgi:hypothetical protein